MPSSPSTPKTQTKQKPSETTKRKAVGQTENNKKKAKHDPSNTTVPIYPTNKPIEHHLGFLSEGKNYSLQREIPSGWENMSETDLKRFAYLKITLVASESGTNLDLKQKYCAALIDCITDFTEESVRKLLCIQPRYSKTKTIPQEVIENAIFRLYPICRRTLCYHCTPPSELELTYFFQTFINLHTLFGSGKTNG